MRVILQPGAATAPAWQRCCCCAAVLGAAQAAWAQSPPSAPVTLPTVSVTAPAAAAATGYDARRTTTATKTETPLRDVPQAVTVVPRAVIEDQAMESLADVVRFVPGVTMGQGEGNRDQPVFRGIGSTGDFFVDGIRDDIPYYRDLYNIERVEVLKGPNAMIFGRGGSGGVLNRVTRQAQWDDIGEATLRLGSWKERRATADFGRALSDAAAFRVTGVYERSESYRDHFGLERYGVNPTLAWRAGDRTLVRLGYEHFKDERTADRGVPSFGGRPVAVDPSTFFGNPDLSNTSARVDALDAVVDHDFGNGLKLSNHARWAQYEKFYQNVFPGSVNAAGTMVSIAAYNHRTDRTNFFNQTDLRYRATTGSVTHELLFGVEIGRQTTDNVRNTGYFAGGSLSVPLSSPVTFAPVRFAPSATDADNRSTANVAALYVQDQIELSKQWQAIAGVRFDRFEVELDNHRDASRLSNTDHLVSPRVGLIYKPIEPVSIYASYTVAYQPRSGDQLGSLTAANRSLDPEEFRNVELGAKWDVSSRLSATAAVYRLERTNVAVTDPNDPTRSLLVDGQHAQGVEITLAGRLAPNWRVIGGYAYQDGEYDSTQSSAIRQGNRIAQLPRHSVSLWNRYDFDAKWGAGLGVVASSALFAGADNSVTLPGFARVDAAVYYELTPDLRMQLNVENLFDSEYYASAHSNNNIMPGSPRALRVSLSANY
ncbi:MAG: TonB-dependent siderophore receptor [Burkholderiaceae bacterium]|nr:TonB-dependent siderophore receptor [Burkholderiaceae bacterium]